MSSTVSLILKLWCYVEKLGVGRHSLHLMFEIMGVVLVVLVRLLGASFLRYILLQGYITRQGIESQFRYNLRRVPIVFR